MQPLSELTAEIRNILVEMPENKFLMENLKSQHARRLTFIYNNNQLFNRGRLESFNCTPCVIKIISFFKNYIAKIDTDNKIKELEEQIRGLKAIIQVVQDIAQGGKTDAYEKISIINEYLKL